MLYWGKGALVDLGSGRIELGGGGGGEGVWGERRGPGTLWEG